MNGTGSPLSVGGVNVDGLQITGTPLTIGNGVIAGFDNVTFEAMSDAATQLTVNHPGNDVPLDLPNLTFSTVPDEIGRAHV